MEKVLAAYIERMKTHFPGFPGETAHEIASSFLAFRFGLYEKAASECANALALIPDGSPANASLKRALAILQLHATDRTNSVVTTEPAVRFTEADRASLAIVIPAEMIEDAVTLDLDNALILVYVAALVTSPDDEEMLGEHRRTIIKTLTDYKRQMGMG